MDVDLQEAGGLSLSINDFVTRVINPKILKESKKLIREKQRRFVAEWRSRSHNVRLNRAR